ncbi:tRNA 4-thiouridine(8) synthase ThiI [Candidatus Woesearchaeota archaeon]|jgi:tRNA uracil 4-sulfurtransferase|nr:tRNA 4-thiouridine(8) synthase ThiI [Candidatus Woesearchaeota archaeon]MBT4368355.1 tRNA 4-thiouridine(8) synthase ThiI [Candidatus Woesearchaeota archaeon]MBT4712844.1 tRNA 4-thiouridine(8) synthase ThiI [Candidatus Woesearchaeota archaeon]MBT6639756.1 tRNA 4-thiouridine(8) synthase ThiI [Candidatus Woesearchaeota archaeon]MBT7133928.1 tRNA 4-thiouridine(8) synthase ThiI [Candidatus Woesearchaeota archaeon]
MKILVRYAEIGLKGRNRGFFEKTLMRNIKNKLDCTITRMSGRIFLETSDKDPFPKLKKVFGIASFSEVLKTDLDLEVIKKEALKVLKEKDIESFKVETQRSNKQFELTSPEISREVGAFLEEQTKLEVKLKDPDFVLNLEIQNKNSFIIRQTEQGFGGLPVSSAGKVLSLLSGGIDSPVSSLMMMKRGCSVDFIHFHNYPHVKKASIDKVKDLFNLLKDYQNSCQLILIPFTDVQKEIVTKCPAKLRILLYRRFMLRITEKFMVRHQAIVSGESLGQVSSQTLENMGVVNQITSKLFLRPLVGMDKVDIIDLAKQFGTYETSIQPHEDCCTFFVPRSPETKARIGEIELAEKDLDIDALVKACVDSVEIIS